MSRRLIVFAAVALASVAGQASAADPERGRELSVVCQACHGEDGNGIGDAQYPVIAGQYADYLSIAMLAYKRGARQNVIMQGFMASLSEQDIDDLAAFFAAQTGPLDDLSHLK